MEEEIKTYPQGHFLGLGMALGILASLLVGFTISIVFEMPELLGLWPAVGVIIGLVSGKLIEDKYKREGKIRPVTEAEEKKRKKAVKIAVFAGVLALILIIGILLLTASA